jgi:hypothetical protein
MQTIASLILLALCARFAAAAEAPALVVTQKPDRLTISRGSQPVADYVFADDKTLRPFFANVRAPDGTQVTRRHPPLPGQDPVDHDTMHPGIWLAFGNVNGADFWRNQGRIQHVRFVNAPAVQNGTLSFTAENRLLTKDGKVLGTQMSVIALKPQTDDGYLLTWEATFSSSEEDLVFGDQEEMGFGVRVATPITEKNGGRIFSSSGKTSAKATWGQVADWCDYSGIIDGRRVGVALMPDPANFRPSWFHNRDYGVFVANPFGRKAMKQGEESRVAVKKGDTLRLRFGALIYSTPGDQPPDLREGYTRFLGK